MINMNNGNKTAKFVSSVIAGVEAREALLDSLVSGPKSGLSLRRTLTKKLKSRVSNARLYYNLQVLSQAGLLKVRSRWRGKEVELDPKWLQPVREHFGVKPSIVCVGGLEERFRIPSLVESALRLADIKPVRYYYVARDELRRKVSGVPGNVKFIFVSGALAEGDMPGLRRVFEGIITDELDSHQVITDLSDGIRLGVLVLYKLAEEYGLNRFYLPEPEQKITWLT
jgi:DNA-binding PadR family transcriptional regulator